MSRKYVVVRGGSVDDGEALIKAMPNGLGRRNVGEEEG